MIVLNVLYDDVFFCFFAQYAVLVSALHIDEA